jgi:hypothetical protein
MSALFLTTTSVSGLKVPVDSQLQLTAMLNTHRNYSET